MKRFLTLLLILCVLVSLVACGKEVKKPNDVTTDNPNTDDVTQDKNAEYLANVPVRDYGNQMFRILITTAYDDDFYDITTEGEMDPIQAAAFSRNTMVEDRYNIAFEFTAMDGNSSGSAEFATTIRNNAKLDAPFDLILGQAYYCMPLAVEGFLANMAESEYLHFEQDWYLHSIIDDATINNKIYGACGDFVVNSIGCTMGLFFNTRMKDALGIEKNLYDLVRNKEWTLDVFEGMVKDVYSDQNYNYYADENDRYGLVGPRQTVSCLFTATENELISRDNDGVFSIDNYYNEHLISTYENLVKFINSEDVTINAANKYVLDVFTNGNSLFMAANIQTLLAEEARSCSFIGIVPFPLYDLAQTEYHSGTQRSEMFYIPVNVDFERSCIISESLNYQSYEVFMPTYWNTTLQAKVLERPDDAEMLRLIRETSSFGFVEIWEGFFTGTYNFAYQGVLNNSPSISSQWKTNKDVLKEDLEILIDKFF